MLSWLGKQLIAHNMRRISAGDPAPTLRLDHEEVTFRFPGRSSWSGTFHGKDAVREWLGRFVKAGLHIHPDEVVIKGFPWKQTVCVRGQDHLDAPDGQRVYYNRYVIWGHLRWGLLRDYEVYEDTEAPLALDEYLASNRPEALVAR
jgi:ketosteroid isomerase-like protein